MPQITVNGNDIHYRDTGGDAFPVVLAHGFTGNSRNWAMTVPPLREKFRVISPDHRGHGLSHKPAAPEDHALEHMAADLHGLLRALEVSECYLVGHSMGGMISQLLTLEHPEVVRALVLVDTAAEVSEALRAGMSIRGRLLELAREQGLEAVFDEQLKAADPRVLANPAFIQTWREQFLMTSPEAYIGGISAMGRRDSLVPRLKELRIPVLIICGENDAPFLEPSRVMHEAVTGSELVIIPNAGHTPQIEAAPAFNQALLGFLSKVHAGVPA